MVSNVGVTSLLLLVGLASAHRPTSEFQTVLDVEAAEAKQEKVQRSSLEQVSETNATAKANATAGTKPPGTLAITNECAGYFGEMTTLFPRYGANDPGAVVDRLQSYSNQLECPEFFRVLCGGFKQWTGLVAAGIHTEIEPFAREAHDLVDSEYNNNPADVSSQNYDKAVEDMGKIVQKFRTIDEDETFAWALHRLAISSEQIRIIVENGQVKLPAAVDLNDFLGCLDDVVYLPNHIENKMVHVNEACPSFDFNTVSQMWDYATKMEAPKKKGMEITKPNNGANTSFFGGLWRRNK